MQILIDRGANTEAKHDHQQTPLHLAANRGRVPVVEVCRRYYEPSTEARPSTQVLLDRGADLQAIGYNGWTPLHYAVRFGRIDATKVCRRSDSQCSEA